MPHIPKSRATSKDVRAAIRYVQESATNVASSAANREREENRKKAKAYQNLKVKELLLGIITMQIKEISNKSKSDTIDMHQIVEELCKDGVMNTIVLEAIEKIDQFDNNPVNSIKINPTGMNLTKTIERDYMLYMIEFLVRAEVERMKEKRIDSQEIRSILKLEKAQNFEERGKALRLRVRSVVKPLYGAPDKEQRVDKLREETRSVMKMIASSIDERNNSVHNQNGTKQSSVIAIPETSDR